MYLRMETLARRQLVGCCQIMSLADNKTRELWQGFMPRRREIENAAGSVLYSVRVYPRGYFQEFNPATAFEKWAAVEVVGQRTTPTGMMSLVLPEGLYAVFLHRGASTDLRTFQYIFSDWLPQSGYQLDDRPHFEVLGHNYRNDDPTSEEEIWLPIQPQA